MIDPDFFGCSGKLSYDETRSLVSASGKTKPSGDFSDFVSKGRIVTSVDRVHRCAKQWDRFARIALNHAFGDVVCAGATPAHVMLSFEFGIDVSPSERVACSNAFAHELAARNIAQGKCHSSHGFGVSAVTIATLATAPTRDQPNLRRGNIYLSRPIGVFKLHYLAELGIDISAKDVLSLLEMPRDEDFHRASWALMTDVSGHGLIGAAAQAAEFHGIEISLNMSAEHAISPEVLSIPVECLQNPVTSYGIPSLNWDAIAASLATLRETAGPYLGFVEEGDEEYSVRGVGLLVGRYQRSSWGVNLSWSE